MNQPETITLQEAIQRGYTHFVEEEGEHVKEFSKIDSLDMEYYADKICYIVDMNTPKHYSITPDAIKDLVTEYVEDQDTVADEEDKLYKIAEKHDYSTLANELNEKFKAITYYEPLDLLVKIQ